MGINQLGMYLMTNLIKNIRYICILSMALGMLDLILYLYAYEKLNKQLYVD